MMGSSASGRKHSSPPGALERSKQIENEICKDRSIQQQTIKLMLLGNADSGKSTVVKQMKILHMKGFNECEFVNYRYLVFFNIYEAVQSLIQGMEFLKIFFDQETQEVTKKFLALAAAETGFNVEILNLAAKIWRSNAIRRCIEQKHQLQLPDNAEYFMNNLDRIANENFRPNHLDILFCRAHTTGVHETAFPYKKHMIRLIDVGGQKAERKKWIHCFDDITAILFVAALSAYDQVLTESPTENRMYDALSLFDETCNIDDSSLTPLPAICEMAFPSRMSTSRMVMRHLPTPNLYINDHQLKRKGTKAHCLTGLSQNLLKELQNNKRPYLRLNVSGRSYKLLMETILKRGETGLLFTFVNIPHEDRLKICHDYFESTNQYFFERPAELFDYIYTYYVTGFKQRPTCWSQQLFVNELAFWELTQVFLGQPESRQPSGQPDPFGGLAMGKLRRKVWNLVQEPDSSLAAKLVALCSILAVLVSNISLTLASLPELQVNSADGSGNTVPHPAFEIVETGCVALFSIEYFTKMIVAPNRKQVFCEPMNLIDLVAILPFYLELLLGVLGVDFGDMGGLEGAILVVRIVRVLRVVRLLKLGRYSTGLQMFARVFKLSLPQLGMVLIVVAIAVMFFSSLVYFTEKGGADTKFTSIPATFWWSLVTISGVGYGDMCPETVAGKLVASLAITSGLLVLSLPITIIVNHFMQVQDEMNLQNVKNEN